MRRLLRRTLFQLVVRNRALRRIVGRFEASPGVTQSPNVTIDFYLGLNSPPFEGETTNQATVAVRP